MEKLKVLTRQPENFSSDIPKEVARLIEQFREHREAYQSGRYNETQLRREFIDPFFESLGWDVDNKQGHAEAYKDVIHEDSIKIGSATKAPDYCFRIGGVRKFFVETKRPSVNLKEDASPAYQLRRYAWSAKLPLSILTDFEEFAVYDSRIRPLKTDKSTAARILYFTYNDYARHWKEIASIFSREAVLKGYFDKYAEASKVKKGTAGVDSAFLEEIESWREDLAHNLALRNPNLSQRELNFSVQRTIDRIIFLRICEDRGIERYGRLLGLTNGTQIYPRLCELFHRADERYNSGLFYFHEEKNRFEPPDELTLQLAIDDKLLKEMIAHLYYPDSPYEFSVLPADILGQVYEQFLGKVIRLTPGHRAVVEDKPEVKKAGGVYYTPTYIVDYIVKNTVGKLLEGKKPKQVAKLKVLDPACGSGSFLIGAYQYLLDWHRDWYVADGPEGWTKGRSPVLYQAAGGDWRLTTAERRRILLNNVYGVDIDHQAVEVTKLSLSLKVLEGENEQTLTKQFALFHERALPDLGSNIKCGNSLIGPDFYQGKQLSLLDEEERHRINVFDWPAEFSEIMQAGGFHAVIGNPPYGASFGDVEAEYFNRKYKVFSGIKDVYPCFIERSISCLNNGGQHSFIVPSAWLGGPEYVGLRNLLLFHQVESIVLLPFDVFVDAYVDTAIFLISKQQASSEHKVQTFTYGKREILRKIELLGGHYHGVRQQEWKNSEGKKFILDPSAIHLLAQICKLTSLVFSDIVKIKRGVLFDKELLTDERKSPNSYRYFEGDVYRYQINPILNRWIEFDDKMRERPKEFIWFEGHRILLRRLVNRRQRIMAAFASDTFVTNKNLYSILLNEKSFNLLAVLGILNSRLISYLYINQVTQATKDDFPQVTIKDLLALPFPVLEGKKASYGQMVELVEQMLSLNKHMAEVKTPDEKTKLERQITETDRQIDLLVYELYGLTDEEIKIVEAETRK